MPARIILVHDDRPYLDAAALALSLAGHEVASFVNPMNALPALEGGRTTDCLVTRVLFEGGTIHGIALARMAKLKCLDIRIVFVDLAERKGHADGLGVFVAAPVAVSDLVQAIERSLRDSVQGGAPSISPSSRAS